MKQEATFGNIISWDSHGERGVSCQLSGIKDHPKLGDQGWVRTSRVERIEYGDDGYVNVVETRNTIYTRE